MPTYYLQYESPVSRRRSRCSVQCVIAGEERERKEEQERRGKEYRGKNGDCVRGPNARQILLRFSSSSLSLSLSLSLSPVPLSSHFPPSLSPVRLASCAQSPTFQMKDNGSADFPMQSQVVIMTGMDCVILGFEHLLSLLSPLVSISPFPSCVASCHRRSSSAGYHHCAHLVDEGRMEQTQALRRRGTNSVGGLE